MIYVAETKIPGVLVITPQRFSDERGHFCETWNEATLAAQGIHERFVQDNQSLSMKAGTLRGLHLQDHPYGQVKLVRCARGALRDVVVDARKNSPTFGTSLTVDLTAALGQQILIPTGCLHGFVTLLDRTEISYKCSAPYRPDHERVVRFDDPDLAIDWGIDPATVIISNRDKAGVAFQRYDPSYSWTGKEVFA